jgi:beta-lactamase class A
VIAFLLAQLIPTPSPIAIPTATPPPISERALLSNGIDDAQAHARTLGGTLGAVIVDLATGSSASVNADQSLPMQSVQKLPIAILIYRAIDAGTLKASRAVRVEVGNTPAEYTVSELIALMVENSDNTAATALLRMLGGSDAANAALHELNYDGILIDPNDNGFAKPSAIATLLTDLHNGKLLSGSSQSALLAHLAKSTTFPGRLRAGFPAGTLVEHKTGTSGTSNGITAATNDVGIVNVAGRFVVVVAMLADARGDDAERDAVIAAVGHAAYDATRQFPI